MENIILFVDNLHIRRSWDVRSEQCCCGGLLSAEKGSRKGVGDLEKNDIPNFVPLKVTRVSRNVTLAGDEEEVIGRLKACWREERKVDRGS